MKKTRLFLLGLVLTGFLLITTSCKAATDDNNGGNRIVELWAEDRNCDSPKGPQNISKDDITFADSYTNCEIAFGIDNDFDVTGVTYYITDFTQTGEEPDPSKTGPEDPTFVVESPNYFVYSIVPGDCDEFHVLAIKPGDFRCTAQFKIYY